MHCNSYAMPLQVKCIFHMFCSNFNPAFVSHRELRVPLAWPGLAWKENFGAPSSVLKLFGRPSIILQDAATSRAESG